MYEIIVIRIVIHPVLDNFIVQFDISKIFRYSLLYNLRQNSLASLSIFTSKPEATHTEATPLIIEMARSILVTGATGKQGGAVIEALLASPRSSDFSIYALTRSIDSPSATRLAAKGKNIKLVRGDLDEVESIFQTAPEPYWGVFSVQVRLRFHHPHGNEKDRTKELY